MTGWGSVFAQAGYLDSYDRYDEGTREAPFARLGINYLLNDNWSVKLDGAYAGGKKWTDNLPNRIFDFNVESEIRPETWPVSLFTRYEFTQISYHALDSDQYRYGENFHTVMVGLKFRSGTTLHEADRAPGSLDLPSLGKWVAFNANEQPVASRSQLPFICLTDDHALRSESRDCRVVEPLFPQDPIPASAT
ncbi:hypothetical protein [Aminobacter ciceronei]|uniref:TonB-dependent receptor-like beta-barrel domain-containing protein n=1 Tax=Aminobacter ciceronei TaxID=150723 RepID=A0ABR6C808_9HYPH|nr:hypothetical protein [Aminobacter ciceronei]MBA8907376.1 hypothetical protein [Aminobacter ciceronei]MBA9021149.1 hypothetical protein [Aminobacter ciceronei]